MPTFILGRAASYFVSILILLSQSPRAEASSQRNARSILLGSAVKLVSLLDQKEDVLEVIPELETFGTRASTFVWTSEGKMNNELRATLLRNDFLVPLQRSIATSFTDSVQSYPLRAYLRSQLRKIEHHLNKEDRDAPSNEDFREIARNIDQGLSDLRTFRVRLEGGQ